MIGSGEPHEYDWLWGAALVSMIDIEPDCGWPMPRAFRVGAKNVGQRQDRVLVPRTWASTNYCRCKNDRSLLASPNRIILQP
jgi:hypothetical protein